MAFTDRFISVPVFRVAPENEITGKEGEMIKTKMLINPRRIESMGEAIPRKDFREDNKIWTSIVMESGDDFLVRIPLDKMEKLLNEAIK